MTTPTRSPAVALNEIREPPHHRHQKAFFRILNFNLQDFCFRAFVPFCMESIVFSQTRRERRDD
jgi:hypothetical protein